MDSYSANLYDQSTSKSWGSMSNSERLASMTNTNNLAWSGTNVNSSSAASSLSNGINTGKVEMYAPSPYESGSSVSHFSKDATPNEIMEPSYTELLTTPGMVTQLLQDIGWAIHSSVNSAPVLAAIGAQSSIEDNNKVISLSATDSDGTDTDSETFVVTISSDNDLPIFTNVSSGSTQYGDTLSINLTATDIETANNSIAFTVQSFDNSKVSASISGLH